MSPVKPPAASSHLRAVPSLNSSERANDIAGRALAILAAQSEIAASALREMSETLGVRVSTGVVNEPGGKYRAFLSGADLGEFANFDAAVEAVYRNVLKKTSG